MAKLGQNLEEVQKWNQALILECIRSNPQISRSEISAETGLNRSTVTNIVSDLIRRRFVEESGIQISDKGRKPIGLNLYGGAYSIAAVHLRDDTFDAVLFDFAGAPLCGTQTHALTGTDQDHDIVADLIEQLSRQFPEYTLLGVGAALSPAAQRAGTMQSVCETELRLALNDRLDTRFFCQYPAGLAALAHWLATGPSARDGCLVYVDVGDKIDAGVVTNGGIIHDCILSPGTLGHMSINFNAPLCSCGSRGCLEMYASIPAIMGDLAEKCRFIPASPLTSKSTFEDIVFQYHKHDELASAVVDSAAHYLGVGIASVVNLLSPTNIFIGGRATRFGREYLHAVREYVRRYTPHSRLRGVRLDLSKLLVSAELVGAYHMVQKNYFLGEKNNEETASVM